MFNYVRNTGYNLCVDLPIALAGSVCCTGLTITGVMVSAASVLALGKSNYLNHNASKLLAMERLVLTCAYHKLIRVFNPKYCANIQTIDQVGVITDYLSRPIFQAAQEKSKHRTALDRHVFSRSLYAVAVCVSAITRIADVALGLLAAAVSIIPFLGRNMSINNFALKQLSLNVLYDVCHGIRGVVNPQQFNYFF